ncbi:FxSxx-COOH system tetratricopeptide repeat protein [Longispora urticae]
MPARLLPRSTPNWAHRLLSALGSLLAGAGTLAGFLAQLPDPTRSQLWLAGFSSVVAAVLSFVALRESLRHSGASRSGTERAAADRSLLTATNLPPRTTRFVGRAEILESVDGVLHGPDSAGRPRSCVLWGLGGVGKTTTAVEYAYRSAGRYAITWLVRAERTPDLTEDLLELARALGVDVGSDAKAAMLTLLGELRARDDWLLIVDNAEDREVLAKYWPSGAAGDILITSRLADWHELVQPQDAIELEVLGLEDAVALLTQRTGDGDRAAAVTIARQLGRLPLALDHAASYVAQSRITLGHYERLLTSSLAQVLSRYTPDPRTGAVAGTWALSLARARELAPAADDLMSLLAMVAPEDFPRSLLTDHGSRLGGSLGRALAEPVSVDLAVGALAGYSLVKAQVDRIDVHRLVQAVVRLHLGRGTERSWLAKATALLCHAFPRQVADSATWPLCARLVAHVIAVQEHSERLRDARRPGGAVRNRIDEGLCELLDRAGGYLLERSSYADAEPLIASAVALRARFHGEESREHAQSLAHQARLFYRLATLEPARRSAATALVIQERVLGPRHEDLIDTLLWLGKILIEFSELDEAQRALERARAIARVVWDANDQRVVAVDEALGATLMRKGRPIEALAVMGQARAILVHHGGPAHLLATLDGAMGLVEIDIGFLRRDPSLVRRARDRLVRGVEVMAALYGDDHFVVTNLRDMLSLAHLRLGDHEAAHEVLVDVVAGYAKSVGDRHPSTALGRKRLGAALRGMGDHAAAGPLITDALEVYEQVYGPGHPYVAEALIELGLLHRDMGDGSTAESTLDRALRIMERNYGPAHPVVVSLLEDLADLAGDRDDEDAAAELRRRADRARAAVLAGDGQSEPSDR